MWILAGGSSSTSILQEHKGEQSTPGAGSQQWRDYSSSEDEDERERERDDESEEEEEVEDSALELGWASGMLKQVLLNASVSVTNVTVKVQATSGCELSVSLQAFKMFSAAPDWSMAFVVSHAALQLP